MGKVTLEGLEFFAYHGYYDEEQKVGNKYAVDVTVYADFDAAAEHDKLSETVDYETLYNIVAAEMKIRSRLLENIGLRVIRTIFKHFPEVNAADVSVSKFNPPIGGVCNRARVSLMRERKNFNFQLDYREKEIEDSRK